MWKLLELFCGMTCGLFGLLPFFSRYAKHAFELSREWPGLLLDIVLLFFLPGLLVAVGTYFHAVRGKTGGLILLSVGGIFLTIMMFVHLLGGVLYIFGLGAGLVIITQGLLALITVISAVIAGRSK